MSICTRDRKFWELLEKHAPNVERFMFAGGEPLLCRQHFEFLSAGLPWRFPGVISSHINATTLPAQIYETWPQFRSVRLVISLDGFGAVNEFIRYPTKWDALYRNLTMLDERAEELNIREMGFNTTVQAYNVLSLPELFDNCFGPSSPILDLSAFANFPSCFSVQILPPHLKQKAAARLKEFRQRYRGHWPKPGRSLGQFERKMDGLIEHMMAVDRQDESRISSAGTRFSISIAGGKAKTVLPELEALFEKVDSRLIQIGSETDGERERLFCSKPF